MVSSHMALNKVDKGIQAAIIAEKEKLSPLVQVSTDAQTCQRLKKISKDIYDWVHEHLGKSQTLERT